MEVDYEYTVTFTGNYFNLTTVLITDVTLEDELDGGETGEECILRRASDMLAIEYGWSPLEVSNETEIELTGTYK
jgi:hypothetical protein